MILAIGVAATLFGAEPPAAARPSPSSYWVFVGNYTEPNGSKGIYRYELDLATGKLTGGELAVEAKSPSFLAIHPNLKSLYAVSEVSQYKGKPSGSIQAFSLNAKTGELAAKNSQPSGGSGPCHLVVDPQGKAVLAANYGGGSACAIPILSNGDLGETSSVVQHEGKSVNPRRQEGPHAHSINLDPQGRFAFVADLGLDQVRIYKFDPAKAELIPNDPPFVAVKPGAGPRHFAFHPNGRNAYVINELDSTVTVFNYDPDQGKLTVLETVSTLNGVDHQGANYPAEVVVHPSGKFVYGSNRGHDSLAIFAADPQTGKLRPVGHETRNIKNPRNFAIDPTGAYLIAAGQDNNLLQVFRVNLTTGALDPVGEPVRSFKPVCIRFVPRD